MNTDMDVEYLETEKFLNVIALIERNDKTSGNYGWFSHIATALDHVRTWHASRSKYEAQLAGIVSTLIASRRPDLFDSYTQWEEWNDRKREVLDSIHEYMSWLRASSWLYMPMFDASWSQPFRFRREDEQKEAYYGA